MHTYKLETQIPSDHRVSIQLPADFPVGGAEIIVLAKPLQSPAKAAGESMAELVAWLRSLPPSNRSPEDFAAQIQAERNAWGD